MVFIIFTILIAISPETPVSISSKISVGNAILSAIKYLIAKMSRDNSPPEATFLSDCGATPLLAENRMEHLLIPFLLGSMTSSSIFT